MEWINKILALPFHQKLLLGAVILMAAAGGLHWGDFGIAEGSEYLFVSMAVVCVVGAVYSYNQTMKLKAEVKLADAKLRGKIINGGGDPEDDKTRIKLD
tara:strand:- start:2937 stop:3233 length:297 start_codon:yes stop_codon:yes gene_type:complete